MMEEKQIGEEIDQLEQNQGEVSPDYADDNADQRKRNNSQVGGEIC
jgi:hypothetical protein